MPITLGGLLSRHISPSHKVLCIGAFTSPVEDPSPLYAASIIGKGPGELHILDNYSSSLMEKLESRARDFQHMRPRQASLWSQLKQAKRGGFGDARAYKRNLLELRKLGFAIKAPKTRLADARDTDFADKQFDVLIDAGTMDVLLSHRPHGASAQEDLDNILREYARISKKLIFVWNHSDRNPGPGFLRLVLSKAGAEVKAHSVLNAYLLSLPGKVRRRLRELDKKSPYGKRTVFNFPSLTLLRHYHEYDRSLVAEWPENKKSEK